MTVAWITNPGGIMRRLGAEFAAQNSLNTMRGATTDDDVTRINTQFPSPTTEEQVAINGLYQQADQSRQNYQSWFGQLTTYAIQTLVAQVNADTTLPQATLNYALAELIRQMEANAQFIQRPTLTQTVTPAGTNDGDAVLYCSVVGTDGTQQDYLLAETVDFLCTQDAAGGSNGGATQYAETFTYMGDPVVSQSAYNWPGGSGVQGTVNCVDAATTTANLISNGAFATWASAVAPPENWTFAVGVAGTSLVRAGSADAMRSENYALEMVSDGATVLKVRQQMTNLIPETVYAVNVWAKINNPAAGQVAVRLVDGTGAVITDVEGTANSCPIDTNTLTTSYQPMEDVLASGTPFFRTPRAMPSTVYLEIAMTTPPTSGRQVFIDLVAVAPATQLYTNGPYVAMFSGQLPSIRQDFYGLALTNSRTACQFVFCMDRDFGLQAANLKIPSNNSPTIPDALIQNTVCVTTTTSTTTTTTTT